MKKIILVIFAIFLLNNISFGGIFGGTSKLEITAPNLDPNESPKEGKFQNSVFLYISTNIINCVKLVPISMIDKLKLEIGPVISDTLAQSIQILFDNVRISTTMPDNIGADGLITFSLDKLGIGLTHESSPGDISEYQTWGCGIKLSYQFITKDNEVIDQVEFPIYEEEMDYNNDSRNSIKKLISTTMHRIATKISENIVNSEIINLYLKKIELEKKVQSKKNSSKNQKVKKVY